MSPYYRSILKRLLYLIAFTGILLLRLDAAPVVLVRLAGLGDQALAAGKPDRALDYYDQVSLHGEGRPAAALGIARARLALAQQNNANHDHFEDALEAWFDVIPYQGFSLPVRRGLAETYLGLGQYQAAYDQWDIVYSADPSDPSLWYQLAPSLLAGQEWDAAARAYAELASVEPGNAEFSYLAGLLLLDADPGRSIEYLIAARDGLAYLSRSQTLLEAARETLYAEDETRSAFMLGLAYFQVGEPALAIHQFESVLKNDPSLAEAWAYLGMAQFQLGMDGWPSFGRALELAPSSPAIHGLAGHYWLDKNRPDLARQEFLTAWQLDPTGSAFMIDVASTYQLEGDLATAEAWYQSAIRREPDNPTFWTILAWFYSDTAYGQADSGLVAARHAVALAPEDPAALDALGWAQMENGQTRLAETNLAAAHSRAPSSSAIVYHLGVFYKETAQRERARECFQQVLILDPPCRDCKEPSSPYAGLARRELDETVQ